MVLMYNAYLCQNYIVTVSRRSYINFNIDNFLSDLNDCVTYNIEASYIHSKDDLEFYWKNWLSHFHDITNKHENRHNLWFNSFI